MRTLRSILLVLLALLTAAPLAAAPYRWANVTVGGGGFAPGIVFSRVEQGLAYLRTDMGGAYRWDAKAARWIPLQDMLAEGSYQGIESIAPDPVDPDKVYLAAGMYRRDPAAILRSSDRGTSWDVVPVPFRMGGNEDGRGVGERLAIDPVLTSTLYFASRHDGLQRSSDSGRSWSRVESFPLKGLSNPPSGRRTNVGLSFVVFAPVRARATQSRTIFVGSADPGDAHLFRSDDAGASWAAISGGPGADMLPVKAEMGNGGTLYITYSNHAGPNGATEGAVWRLDIASGAWRDITPDKGGSTPGGYMGLSVDRMRPDTLVVSSLNRPGDTIWRSTDGGASWTSLAEVSERDVTASPFLLWGEKKSSFGWWIAGLAIDPFDSGRIAYTTGATLYLTDHVGEARPLWRPWVAGIEQTAVLALASPPAGPPLLSGFGDLGGFVHARLDRSPASLFADPVFTNTNTLDFAELRPEVVVRSGAVQHVRGDADRPTLAWSGDGGFSWTPLRPPGSPPWRDQPRYDPLRDAPIIVSADGATFLVARPQPLLTRDHGRNWSPVSGLPQGVRIIADRTDPASFYALDPDGGRLFASADGGASFAAVEAKGLPDVSRLRVTWREGQIPLLAAPGRAGALWLALDGDLWRSENGGRSFTKLKRTLEVELLSFGKAPPGRDHPALFATGRKEGLRGVWRSDDEGRGWVRINDDAHQWGLRFRCIAGDPRVFGRVYVGTDGRGILYGEPAS